MPEEGTSPPSRDGGGAAAGEVVDDTAPVVGSTEGVTSSHRPSPSAGGEATPQVNGSTAASSSVLQNDKDDDGRKKWFNEMRGWVMVIAVQIAGFTYQAGLNPPGDLLADCASKDKSAATVECDRRSQRYKVFLYCNTAAFMASLVIIILLMNRPFYGSVHRVKALEVIVVFVMVGLMAAYWAGSTRTEEKGAYTLMSIALALFVVYVVYAVQLAQKLWGGLLFLPHVVWRRVRMPARRGVARDGMPPLPELVVPGAPPQQHHDAVWSISTPHHRRVSRLAPISKAGQTHTKMTSP